MMQATAEAQEADEMARELGMVDKDLQSMISLRHSQREKEADSFFAHLESKYAKPKKSKKGKWRKNLVKSLINFFVRCIECK